MPALTLIACAALAFARPAPSATRGGSRAGACARTAVRAAAPRPDVRERDAAARRELLRAGAGFALASAAQLGCAPPPPAWAASSLNKASSAGSAVNKDPDSLLRYGLPISQPDIRSIQKELEESKPNCLKALWSKALGNVQKARGVLKAKGEKIQAAVAPERKADAADAAAKLGSAMDALEVAITKLDADAAVAAQTQAVGLVGAIEEAMVAGFPYQIPDEFDALPRLLGRASVELVLSRGPRSEEKTFDVGGELAQTIRVVLLLDGYNAPLTAGNFVDLVKKGFYTGMEIQRSDGFVVQTGDPRGIEPSDESAPNGYQVDGKTRNVPLEVFPVGAKAPVYGATFDEEGYGGAAATIPFQAYGALGMAREEYSADSASSQWFWLLFDSDLTPAGKNLLDGRYACFGYTIDGQDQLRAVKVGDVIKSAKLLSGGDKLVAGK